MESLRVLEILDSLEEWQKSGLTPEEANCLHERGLIIVLSKNEYEEQLRLTAELEGRQKQVDGIKNEILSLQSQARASQEKLDSWVYRVCSRVANFGNEGLDALRGDISYYEGQIKKKREEKSKIDADIEAMPEISDDLDEFVEESVGFAAITEPGSSVLEELRARAPRLNRIPFEAFWQGLLIIRQAVQDRYARFKDAYWRLVAMNFDKDEANTVWLAMSLSENEGDLAEIIARGNKISDIFDNRGWDDYAGLRTVGGLARRKGDAYQVVGELEEMFDLMLEEDNSDSYSTLYEALLILDIPGKNAREKFSRYQGFLDPLDELGWSPGIHATCCIAAKLALCEGAPEYLAKDFRALEVKIVKRGASDSTGSGIATLTLYSRRGSQDERADNFHAALDAMVKKGWPHDEETYPSAAVVAIMPGTVRENVLILDEVHGMLREDGFEDIVENITSLAAQVMAGRFKYMKGLLADFAPKNLAADISAAPDSAGAAIQDTGFDLMDLLVVIAVVSMLSDTGQPLAVDGASIENLNQFSMNDIEAVNLQLDSVFEDFHVEMQSGDTGIGLEDVGTAGLGGAGDFFDFD